jgi:hypothetical protein
VSPDPVEPLASNEHEPLLSQRVVKLATGAGFGGGAVGVAVWVVVLVPPPSLTVSVTEYVPAAA